MRLTRDQLHDVMNRLPSVDRGGSVPDVLGVIDLLAEAGYRVDTYLVDDRRVYRATDPETGEREQVVTVPGAVTDWRAVTGVAYLWRVPID